MWAGACVAEGAETPWAEAQVGWETGISPAALAAEIQSHCNPLFNKDLSKVQIGITDISDIFVKGCNAKWR